jgi:hypothetical protein
MQGNLHKEAIMALLAFAAPRPGRARLRRFLLAAAGVSWALLVMILLAHWLSSPDQRNVALVACETLGRAGLRCPQGYAKPPIAADCENLGRGGRLCSDRL